MPLEITVPFWILALSYWVHLAATVVWLGGMTLISLIAWPAVRRKILELESWTELRRRLSPWANGSLVILWITGFLQMTADDNYQGFLAVETTWAQAILVKHLAVIAMTGLGLYSQWRIHPALERVALLAAKRPEAAAEERRRLAALENRLLRLNLVFGVAVLFFTAVATAV